MKLFEYLNNFDDSYYDNALENFIDYIELNQSKNKENFEHFLKLLVNIYNNFCPKAYIFKKIEEIILCLKNIIRNQFSNIEIFNIFKNNKKMLLLIIENQIIDIDEYILKGIVYESQLKETNFYIYFYPELKSININIGSYDLDDFNEKRHIGENESYICSIIRHDSVDEFVAYVNRTNLSIRSRIKQSIFETNSFLINKEPTLIEYATFFGSIQIIIYLVYNNVSLTSSLWLYAIHSGNGEIIHILEERHIIPNDSTYFEVFIESIKCHQNDIARYIKENYIDLNYNEDYIYEKVIPIALEYHNYSFLHTDLFSDSFLFYMIKFGYMYENHLNEITKDIKFLSKLAICSSFTSIENFAYSQRNTITEIIIPNSVCEIGKCSFSGCLNLKKICIPSSVKVIGEKSFGYCFCLEEIKFDFSASLNIHKYAFYKCRSLEKIALPPCITSIEDGCFYQCLQLKEISIPNSVTFIGNAAFYGCISLEKFQIPSSLESIQNSVFENCINLKTIEIPSSVKSIGNYAFSKCSNLNTISLSPSLESIGNNAFEKCESLYNIQIPFTVNSIGKSAFKECTKLYNVSFEENSSLTKIDDFSFCKCTSLTKILIPSSVTSIGKFSFKECTKLYDVSFEENSSLTKIDDYSFFWCTSLTYISIPYYVNTIGCYAFNGCFLLREVKIPNSLKSIRFNSFNTFNEWTQLTSYDSSIIFSYKNLLNKWTTSNIIPYFHISKY